MNNSYFIVDAFTDKPFCGNPAAVFLLKEEITDELMQKIAAEMNLSETAFLLRNEKEFILRWFTPTLEVDLCGHATLASAHVLWEMGLLSKNEEAVFSTKSGVLTARRSKALIEMDFPMEESEKVDCPNEIKSGLDIEPKYVGKNRFDYLVEVESEKIVRGLQPNFEMISRLDSRGVIITSIASSKDYDFVSRFFAPQSGISEDPVTGSAHCCLGPYWAKKLGKKEMVGHQISVRGGVVIVKVNESENKVILSGHGVIIMNGKLFI